MKSDRRVIILLMIIAVVAVCVMIFRDAMREEGREVRGERREARDERREIGDERREMEDKSLECFDPNTVDSLTLLKYGLGPMQIRSLMGYRRHGGRFDKPLAVSKLYNWSDEDVDKVLPYIRIDEKFKKTYKYREQYEREVREERRERRGEKFETRDERREAKVERREVEYERGERKYQETNKFRSLTKVDINSADTTLLKRIPGVGSGIANSIIKLREKLGGFYDVRQLEELSFVSPELYEWFDVGDKSAVHLININKASFQVLNAHPYISYNQTRDLMTYRRLYGTIKDKDALVSTNIFTKEEVERLAPYLEF